MKKVIIVLFFFTLIMLINNNNTIEEITLPSDSIRFRIIANSNSLEDQTTKIKIKERIENEVFTKLPTTTNINEYRRYIKDSIPAIKEILNESNIDYDINFGDNYFPIKEFKGVTYEEGNYESLVITLGSGKGHNWWCVLFPPLCTIDAKAETIKDVEYKSFIQEVLNKYL